MSLLLSGKTVLVTRPRHQVSDLAAPLEALGAEVIAMPAIDIAPPSDLGPLDRALRDLESYDWVVLTSVNGVQAVAERMDTLGIPRERLRTRRLAVIGPATAHALAREFRAPDVVPTEYVSEAIGEALGEVAGQRFLLARADLARKDLATLLTARGAEVTDVPAYAIVRVSSVCPVPAKAPDFITLTSSEAVKATHASLTAQGHEDWFGTAALVCIGPITASTVRDLGYEPAAVAETYTVAGLIDALLSYGKTKETTNA